MKNGNHHMLAWTKFIVIAMGLAVAACATDTSTGYAPNDKPRELTVQSDSTRFPPSVGIFERHKVIAYRAGLKDVSIGYNSGDPQYRSGSTVYFYPVYDRIGDAAANLEHEFEAVKAQISRYPGGTWIEERALVQVKQPSGPISGLSATYRFRTWFFGAERDVYSELQLFMLGERFVKFRHTYPVEHEDFLRPEIDNFMTKLRWEDVDEEALALALGQTL